MSKKKSKEVNLLKKLIMKVKKYFNKKGFTLVELLAVIVILSLILTVTIYVVTDVISKSKEKSYQVTINNIEKKSGSYLTENSNRLFFLRSNDNLTEYQCVTVENLIDYGYLDNNVLESYIDKNKKVSIKDYVYLERDVKTKAITKTIYTLNDNDIYDCGRIVNAQGDINFNLSPDLDTWAREKTLTITYRLSNVNNVNTLKDYQYKYTYDGASSGSNDDSESTKTLQITSNGTMHASIVLPGDEETLIASSTYDISKIDTTGPVVTLKNNETKTVKQTVTIPITVTDSESGVNYNSFTKDDIEITIGNTSVSNFTLTKKDDNGNYEVTINDTLHDGKVEIKVKEKSIYDNVVDTVKNGNEETTLETNITFDSNYTVEIRVTNGTGATTKTVKYNEQPTFTVTPNNNYGDPAVSCTNNQTASISGTTLTTGKITSNTVCSVTYKQISVFAFSYTGQFKVCTGSNYSTCTNNKNTSYTISTTPWAVKFLTSGTLTVSHISSNVDIFLVGGGQGGYGGRTYDSEGATDNGGINYAYGGSGGSGGATTTKNNFSMGNIAYTITIGAGGSGGAAKKSSSGNGGSTGGNTSITCNTGCSGLSASGGSGNSNNGANQTYDYKWGTYSWGAATKGSDGVYAFGNSSFDGIRYGAGGGGGGAQHDYRDHWHTDPKAGGTTGGGKGGAYAGGQGNDATANTGSGGGGGGAEYGHNIASSNPGKGGKGGSGIVIIKNRS